MANFSTWDRATLEQFAQEATDNLVAYKEIIDAAVNMFDRVERALGDMADVVAKHRKESE